MRFNNIAMLLALAATTQLTIAAPTPAWNDKDHETGYKAGARLCTLAGAACRITGHPTAGNALLGAAAGFGAVEVAVTGSQGVKVPAAAIAVKNGAVAGAKAVGNGAVAGAKVVGSGLEAVGKCVGNACIQGYRAATGHNRPAAPSSHARSVETRGEVVPLLARSVETRGEVVPLLTRSAEPEAEPKLDDQY